MPNPAVEVLAVAHEQLTDEQLHGLRQLFDAEYLASHGDWDPDQPYGYAPHDVHLLAMARDAVVGHVGWERRSITVGGEAVAVAGVGGVLVSPSARGQRLGQGLLAAARESMLREPTVGFGYLGCDESVAPFYASCGWTRITVAERWTDHEGTVVDSPPGQPLFVLPVHRGLDAWPRGLVDLHGRPW